MSARVAAAVLVLAVALACADPAAGAVSFDWRVPDRLGGDGVASVARSVDDAAAPPPVAIELRTCARDATWTLDGEPADVTELRRCTWRMALPDGEAHDVGLAAEGGTATARVRSRDILVVSLGDSVASGEGNPDDPRVVGAAWLERRCHRSMRSGAAQAALALERAGARTSVTFLPLGCSGATVDRGLIGAYAGIDPDARKGPLAPQLAELAALQRRRPVDAVLLSVGANDVHFGDLARFCMTAEPCRSTPFDPRDPTRPAPPGTPTADEILADAMARLPGAYDRVDAALADAGIDSRKVVVVEYFDPTHDAVGDTCGLLLPGVRPEETEWAQTNVLRPLNDHVARAADRHGWRLVRGVQAAFSRHGICAEPRSNRWVVQIAESLGSGAATKGPLHPNQTGHLATAALIGPVLAEAVALEEGPPPPILADDGIGVRDLVLAALAGALAALGLELVVRRLRERRRPSSRR